MNLDFIPQPFHRDLVHIDASYFLTQLGESINTIFITKFLQIPLETLYFLIIILVRNGPVSSHFPFRILLINIPVHRAGIHILFNRVFE